MVNDTFGLIARRTRKWSVVNASRHRWYSASTPITPVALSRGTASAARRLLNLLGSFRYPGSTEGLPLTIGLHVSATQPESPCLTGICNDENSRKFSPLTYSGNRQPSRWT